MGSEGQADAEQMREVETGCEDGWGSQVMGKGGKV